MVETEMDRSIAPGGDVEHVRIATTYDLLDRVETTSDPGGLVRKFVYDVHGNVESQLSREPGASEWRLDATQTYDSEGRVLTTQNGLLDVATYTYDEMGRQTGTRTPLGYDSRVEYDAAGNVVATTDASGATTRTEYDANNRPIRTIDALSRVHETRYDHEGRVVETYAPNGAGTRLVQRVVAMTPDGLPLQIEDADGYSTHLEYDELGNVTCSRSPEGVATTSSYDIQGRLLKKRELVSVATGNPDVADVASCAELEVALNVWRDTTFAYDDLGRLESTTTPDGETRYVEYDELGNITARVNAEGERLEFRYDSRGKVLTRAGPGIADAYTYDARGRQVLAANQHITRATAYDELDRIVSVSDPYFGRAHLVYDADGRVTQAVYPDGGPEGVGDAAGFPDGRIVTYHYNGRGQVTAVVDTEPGVGVWQMAYDAIGRPIERRDPFGASRTTSYDARGFIDEVNLTGTDFADRYTYSGYDERGNPGTIVFDSSGGIETTSITYDALGRIDTIAYPGAAAAEQFTYDRLGNRRTHVRDGMIRTYEYPETSAWDQRCGATGNPTPLPTPHFDQLCRITEAPVSDPTSTTEIHAYGYSANGERLTHSQPGNPAESYAYDVLGRLTSFARAGGETFDLRYDAVGTRFERITPSGDRTRYFGQWAEHRQGANRRLVHGPGVDQILAEVERVLPGDPEVHALMRDASANVTHVAVDGSAEAGGPRRYSAFGALRSGSSTVERGYASLPTAGGSGLIYMRARHYDPETGRFLQPDPQGVVSTQRFAYAEHNPFVYSDPTGRVSTAFYRGVPSLSGSSNDSTLDRGISAWAGFSAGAGLGAAFGMTSYYGLAALHTACPPCGAAVDVGLLGLAGYQLYQEWQSGGEGTKQFLENVGNFATLNGSSEDLFFNGLTLGFGAQASLAGGGARGFYGSLAPSRSATASMMSSSAPGRVFWSGGRQAMTAARQYAEANAGQTLEMTITDRLLEAISTPATRRFLAPAWDAASRRFARGAGPSVDFFQSKSRGIRPDSTWLKIEYPELQRKNVEIRYHLAP